MTLSVRKFGKPAPEARRQGESVWRFGRRVT
jgi:hypothetical protein